MNKWFVKVETQELAKLQGDMRDLGSLLTTQQGDRYLVFHDGFVALKVASYLGLKRKPGQFISHQHQPLVRFDDGEFFLAEA
jgi:hypothetical protein